MKRRLAAGWAGFLDRLLGSRCHACGHRVFPQDLIGHYRFDCRGAR